MKPPSNLLLKFSQKLFPDSQERQAFIDALLQPQPLAPAILWTGTKPETSPFPALPPLDWQPAFCDRLLPGTRPGQHPLHQQGRYYCLDFASVFAATPLLSLPRSPQGIIDLCAAPGGKSLFAWCALKPGVLLCNEVIGKRLGMLIANLKRCQVDSVAVFNLDAENWAEWAAGTAAVVLVDAPCTGQSLLAKGEQAPGCFHPVTINKNASRQKRILANAAQLVAPQGYLLYTTCAFSIAENEQVSEWVLGKFPQLQPVPVPALADYQSPFRDFPCYRLWPQSGLGAGGYTILLQNTETGKPAPLNPDLLTQPRVKWASGWLS